MGSVMALHGPFSEPNPSCRYAEVEMLRQQRHRGERIATEVGSRRRLSRILRRVGLNVLRDQQPAEPVRRYEREHTGELIHIETGKLGQFNRITIVSSAIEWGQAVCGPVVTGPDCEYVAVRIGDLSRTAFRRVVKADDSLGS